MFSTMRNIGDVVVLELRNVTRNRSDIEEESEHLENLINDIGGRVPLPVTIVDLSNLTDLVSWELADLNFIVMKALRYWRARRVIIVAQRREWREKITHQYGDFCCVYPNIEAAMAYIQSDIGREAIRPITAEL